MGLRIAFFGQAAFGKDVLIKLVEEGHEIVGVYVPPDLSPGSSQGKGRPDPLAVESGERNLRLFRHERFRRKGAAIAELVDEHRELSADLNVLAFVTAILPSEIVDGPTHGSLCFHPSLLPRVRGGAALAWQLISGERESGVTIFRPDAGVDTGPIVVRRGGIEIEDTHTAGTLYFEHLYGLGVDAMAEAVAAVAAGTAQYEPQDESKATSQGLVGDREARVDWSRSAVEIDRLLRGCDPQPGAHAQLDDQLVRLYDARLIDRSRSEPAGTLLGFEQGKLQIAAHGGILAVGRVRVGGGKKLPAGEAGLEAGRRFS
ncbi:MAG: methionyl-tRNA formyltransferase [Myxococcota bacterium]